MREILFRGKSDLLGWVEGWYCPEVKWGEHHFPVGITHKTKEGWLDDVVVIPETIGQFTGLTDKNGKKIFEGDIIKSDNGKQSAVSVVCYGEFSPRMFYDLLENFVMQRPKEKIVGLFLKSTGEEMLLSNNSKLIEVIGNIHDNPELLKEE